MTEPERVYASVVYSYRGMGPEVIHLAQGNPQGNFSTSQH